MSKDFIKLETSVYHDKMIVNINNITFYQDSRTLYINGVHGEGNSIIDITAESHARLLKMVESRLWCENE